MRIAYVANYQGPALIERRPCLHNLSLAARTKIPQIAELLQRNSHEVELISQGQVEPATGRDRFRARFFPGFEEPSPLDPTVTVQYASALSLKYVTGFWESVQTRRLLARRHRHRPFDLLLIYNLQRAQVGCARYASRVLRIPVVLQYEDDAFVDIHGKPHRGFADSLRRRACREVLGLVAGGMGVSPYLLSQMPTDVPKLLLRGTVSDDIRRLAESGDGPSGLPRQNWVVFSGTHEWTQGLEPLVTAWRKFDPPDWQLHLAGTGPITGRLQELARGCDRIVFHGLLNRAENARLLCQARIGMNPQDLTKVPGSVFPFKIIEYLAAGLHVITTPRGAVEPDLDEGISYVPDNSADTLAKAMAFVVNERRYAKTAQRAALETYGPRAISRSLDALMAQAVSTA